MRRIQRNTSVRISAILMNFWIDGSRSWVFVVRGSIVQSVAAELALASFAQEDRFPAMPAQGQLFAGAGHGYVEQGPLLAQNLPPAGLAAFLLHRSSSRRRFLVRIRGNADPSRAWNGMTDFWFETPCRWCNATPLGGYVRPARSEGGSRGNGKRAREGCINLLKPTQASKRKWILAKRACEGMGSRYRCILPPSFWDIRG